MSCWILFHEWTKWSEPVRVDCARADAWDIFNNPTHYLKTYMKIQDRTCLMCGEYQEREIS